MTAGLSPAITPMKFDRDEQGDGGGRPGIRYRWDSLDRGKCADVARAVKMRSGMVMWWGEMFEVYLDDNSIHVGEAIYRTTNVLVVREACMDALSRLADAGIVVGLERIEPEG